jgi:hypothetical protein
MTHKRLVIGIAIVVLVLAPCVALILLINSAWGGEDISTGEVALRDAEAYIIMLQPDDLEATQEYAGNFLIYSNNCKELLIPALVENANEYSLTIAAETSPYDHIDQAVIHVRFPNGSVVAMEYYQRTLEWCRTVTSD